MDSKQEIDFSNSSNFAKRAYSKLLEVPKGYVITYGDLSLAIGCSKMGSRAVGNVQNKNPYAPDVPCHRVVLNSGKLGGRVCFWPREEARNITRRRN